MHNTSPIHNRQEALEGIGIVESDNEILDRLFIMLDKTGDQQINFREVCRILSWGNGGGSVNSISFPVIWHEVTNTRFHELAIVHLWRCTSDYRYGGGEGGFGGALKHILHPAPVSE